MDVAAEVVEDVDEVATVEVDEILEVTATEEVLDEMVEERAVEEVDEEMVEELVDEIVDEVVEEAAVEEVVETVVEVELAAAVEMVEVVEVAEDVEIAEVVEVVDVVVVELLLADEIGVQAVDRSVYEGRSMAAVNVPSVTLKRTVLAWVEFRGMVRL